MKKIIVLLTAAMLSFGMGSCDWNPSDWRGGDGPGNGHGHGHGHGDRDRDHDHHDDDDDGDGFMMVRMEEGQTIHLNRANADDRAKTVTFTGVEVSDNSSMPVVILEVKLPDGTSETVRLTRENPEAEVGDCEFTLISLDEMRDSNSDEVKYIIGLKIERD